MTEKLQRIKDKNTKKDKNDRIEKDKKGGTMQSLFETNKEKRWTKEQEVMFSLVVGKTKDVDYNFVSIMINAQIENEDDDPTFLNELREEEMDFVKQYLKIRVLNFYFLIILMLFYILHFIMNINFKHLSYLFILLF